MINRIKDIIERGKYYLLSQIDKGGYCREFHQLRHGPGLAWTTACIGSTLNEFNSTPPNMLGSIIKLQWECGGWSYNQKVMPDADTTLRVLQFFHKLHFIDENIIQRAEEFVISHQQPDGGIATYTSNNLRTMGYNNDGWTISHPCVTALAINVLRNQYAREKAWKYLKQRLNKGDARAYWWKTPLYVLYETGYLQEVHIENDPVEISLNLLLKAKLGLPDINLSMKLMNTQLEDGSFPSSKQFRIPRPTQKLEDITEKDEVIEDRTRTFSTSASIVALIRQSALFN